MKKQQDGEPDFCLAECAPLPPSRVTALRGQTVDVVIEALRHNGPVLRIIENGLRDGATTDERSAGRKSVKTIRRLERLALDTLVGDPLARFCLSMDEQVRQMQEQTIRVAMQYQPKRRATK